MHDLLNDELIGIQSPGGSRRVCLPTLFAQLLVGQVDGYTGLRAHQADPWRVFLVQIAASILTRHPATTHATDASFWREGLVDLADGAETAWSLVVENPSLPALWQHPWADPEKDALAFGIKSARDGQKTVEPKASAPDELDVLVTAKNHDVKMARLNKADPEAWLFALMMVQTTSGFLGKGNYGILRMNGGFASRPVLSWVRNLHPSHRFREELDCVRALREPTLAGAWRYAARGRVLTWLRPWNRTQAQFTPNDLEPWFIEAARPVRLWATANGIVALTATSEARQIGPKTLENGDVGDPWIPLNLEDKKKGASAMTLSGEGFTPGRVVALILQQGFSLTPLQSPRAGVDGWFCGSVLVRGQGKTDGLHALQLPVPAKVNSLLLQPGTRKTLGDSAECLLRDAKEIASALRFALSVMAEGGPEQSGLPRDGISDLISGLTHDFRGQWQRDFFPTLWRLADEPLDAVRAEWRGALIDRARRTLRDAPNRLPLSSTRLWRAQVRSEGALTGLIRKKRLSPEYLDSAKESSP